MASSSKSSTPSSAAASSSSSAALVTHQSQVAGHGDLLTDPGNGRVYKRLSEPEHDFYKKVQNGSRLKPFLPQYFGTAKVNEKEFILLEDLTRGYAHPSVMDIKIGKITYLPSFSKQKIDECIEKARTSTQSTDAYRVCGMQVYTKTTGKNTSMGKEWGKAVKSEHLPDVLLRFLDDGTHFRSDVLDFYIRQLTHIEEIIRTDYARWKFVSSSVLFVYDSEGAVNSHNHHQLPRADLRLIDFAHTLPPEDNAVSVEEVGYLEGLQNLIGAFKKVRANPKYSNLSASLFTPSSSSPLYPHLQHHFVEHHASNRSVVSADASQNTNHHHNDHTQNHHEQHQPHHAHGKN